MYSSMRARNVLKNASKVPDKLALSAPKERSQHGLHLTRVAVIYISKFMIELTWSLSPVTEDVTVETDSITKRRMAGGDIDVVAKGGMPKRTNGTGEPLSSKLPPAIQRPCPR